jgi:undecaprenyl-diphosphatase
MSLLHTIILAIIEGLTEFLPISSTGHMIIAEAFLHTPNPGFTKLFTVAIQFGAILSVIVLYWKRFFQSFNFYYKLLFAFLPAAIIGFALGNFIDSLLENVAVVASTLLIGGVVLLFVDKWFKNADETHTQEISYFSAIKIGLFQCLALIPGVSRSAATIVGGMTQKLNRKNAAEFSFFLAVPTMFAATAYKLLKAYKTIKHEDINTLIIGNIVAFVVALLAIKFFIGVLTKYGFKAFGYYRIIVGGTLLILLAMHYDLRIN